MRILLVTESVKLEEKLEILSSKLEYRAIITDDIELAQKSLKRFGLSKDLLHPMNELQAYVESLPYDYVLSVQDDWYKADIIKKIKNYNVSKDKVLNFVLLAKGNFKLQRVLRYFKEHAREFEMFATGTSTVAAGLDADEFKWKLFNFAKPSQDLYYDFQTAKFAVSCGKNYGKLRYALIGLTPYSFHYDLSKTVFHYRCLILPYFIAMNNLHNFFMSADTYKKFFHDGWLEKKMPVNSLNVNNIYGIKSSKVMDQKAIDGKTNTWAGKYNPETRDENVKILDDYLTFCEDNAIRPIIFRVPVTEKYMANFDERLLDEFDIIVEQACQKHSRAAFVDGWKLKLVTYADFYDHGHMNTQGTAKFSAYLNKFIGNLEKQGR